MPRRNLDLVAVAGLALVAALAVAVTRDAAVRALPGSLLVLVVPGYALQAALLPSRAGDLAERVLLALGSSIAVAVVTAIALDETTAGLTARSWCVSLVAITLVACSVAGVRRRSRPPAATRALVAVHQPTGFAGIALACVALALVVGALVIARRPASNEQGFTVLWAVPSATARAAVTVGLASDEPTTTTYLLRGVAGSSVVLHRRVTLRPGERWTTTMSGSTSRALTPDSVLRVSLYRAALPQAVYRSVHVVLGAVGS